MAICRDAFHLCYDYYHHYSRCRSVLNVPCAKRWKESLLLHLPALSRYLESLASHHRENLPSPEDDNLADKKGKELRELSIHDAFCPDPFHFRLGCLCIQRGCLDERRAWQWLLQLNVLCVLVLLSVLLEHNRLYDINSSLNLARALVYQVPGTP